MIKEWVIMNFSIDICVVHPWGNTNLHRIRTQKLPVKRSRPTTAMIHISLWLLTKNLHQSRRSTHSQQCLGDMIGCSSNAIIGVLPLEPIEKPPIARYL